MPIRYRKVWALGVFIRIYEIKKRETVFDSLTFFVHHYFCKWMEQFFKS